MTFRACRGAGFIPGLFFCFVALDAKFVHDILAFQLPVSLKSGQRLRFLWKHGVTDIAVAKPFLMGMVHERDRAPGATIDLYFFRTFVFYGQADG